MIALILSFVLAAAAALPAQAQTHPATPPASGVVAASATNAVVEKEYQALLAEDDAAQAEVDRWIVENNAFKAKGAGAPDAELNARIRTRFDKVRSGYERFIAAHPDHVRARLAYGSLLSDLQDELGARVQWEKALELDPGNPAVYNNLAGAYSETGQVEKTFEFFAKAIELKPDEALYYHNFANSLWVLRKAGLKYYKLDEQQVFTKCLGLFSNACRLDPANFPFASDLAQSYYALQPLPFETALKAWTNALSLAHDDLERDGVFVHLARVKMLAGQYKDARRQLGAVKNPSYERLKTSLLLSIEEREHPKPATNAPPTANPAKP